MESSYYSQNPRFYVSVDCIIFCFEDGVLKVLLQERYFEPFMGKHTLMGGFVQEGEDVKQTAIRITQERTGLKNVFLEQVGAFGDVDRDPGARVISVAYMALVDRALCDEAITRLYHGYWVDVYHLPNLFFGHDKMVEIALRHLRIQVGKRPVGFSMLPQMFTLSQLQNLYEAILGVELDKRNFRKKIADMTFIQKTEEKDKEHSRRGAALFQFNEEEYETVNKFKL